MRLLRPSAAAVVFLTSVAPAATANTVGDVRLLPVPAFTIPAGHVIGSSDIGQRKFRTTARSLSGIATKSDEVAGKETRRLLQAGKPIPLSALTKPLPVRRGMQITASYEEAGLSISTQLLALEDGGVGDIISLRNTSTGIVVSAEILANGALAVKGE